MDTFKKNAKKSRFWRLYLILVITSIIFYIIVRFFLSDLGEPTSFKKGIKLVINNSIVTSKIGSYTSYTVNTNQLPKETDNPAVFKVAVTGDSSKTVFLTCKMQKDNEGEWILKTIKIDSLKDSKK